MTPIVDIKRTHPNAQIPKYYTSESAAFDFHLVEDVEIPAHGIVIVPSGLIINTPKSHALIIASRSSSPLKYGITAANGIGIIDSDYCGPTDEIRLLLHNLRDTPVKLHIGDRVAQGMIIPIQQVEFSEVEEMKNSDRGGLGSTGV